MVGRGGGGGGKFKHGPKFFFAPFFLSFFLAFCPIYNLAHFFKTVPPVESEKVNDVNRGGGGGGGRGNIQSWPRISCSHLVTKLFSSHLTDL